MNRLNIIFISIAITIARSPKAGVARSNRAGGTMENAGRQTCLSGGFVFVIPCVPEENERALGQACKATETSCGNVQFLAHFDSGIASR